MPFTLSRFFIFSALLLSCVLLEAETLVVDWALPLKKQPAGLIAREEGGLCLKNGKLLLTMRDGRFMVLSSGGRIELTKKYTGEFIFPPVSVENGVLLLESNTLRFLDNSYTEKWVISGKSPIASIPLITGEGIYVQFQDNTVYLVDKEKGILLANYSNYLESQLAYAKLSPPFKYNDLAVFGFSNGQIIHFQHKTAADASTHELMPYYRIKTAQSIHQIEKKDFFDIMSLLPVQNGVLYCNGEGCGIIREGRTTPREGVKNLFLEAQEDGTILGFGERGAFLFDAEGKLIKQVFKSARFVTRHLKAGSYHVFTEAEEAMHMVSADFSETLHTALLPKGFSSVGVYDGTRIYLLSNMGVLYAMRLIPSKAKK